MIHRTVRVCAIILAALWGSACASEIAPSPSATPYPIEVVNPPARVAVGLELGDVDPVPALVDIPPYGLQTPPRLTPSPIPTIAHVEAAASGVPWFVPVEWHEEYLACLDDPERYRLSEWVYAYSSEVRADGWDYGEAMDVAGREGGNDLCQFNTQGSGACGPFQTYYCAGLTAEVHYATAWAKYVAGGYSFDAHWRAYW